MPRTTINIDAPILKDLKKLQKTEGKSLGRIVSELLADALGRLKDLPSQHAGLSWTSRSMGARVDLTDKEAVQAALDAGGGSDVELHG